MTNRLTVCFAAAAVLAQAADLAGTYTLRNMREMGSELLLKPNGSFEYMFAYGAADYWAKGKWRFDKNAVVLTSDPAKDDAQAFRLIKSTSVSTPAVRVRLVGANGRGVPNIDVALSSAKGRTQAHTDSDGIAMFEKSPGIRGVEFAVRVYSFESGMLEVNGAHNDFTFEIDGRAITQVRFQDERLRVDNTALIMRNWGGGDREMRYAKGE
jgi:hypothetical protein